MAAIRHLCRVSLTRTCFMCRCAELTKDTVAMMVSSSAGQLVPALLCSRILLAQYELLWMHCTHKHEFIYYLIECDFVENTGYFHYLYYLKFSPLQMETEFVFCQKIHKTWQMLRSRWEEKWNRSSTRLQVCVLAASLLCTLTSCFLAIL